MYSLVKFEKPERERLFSIINDDNDFSLGFFNKAFLKFQELSESEDVKERLSMSKE